MVRYSKNSVSRIRTQQFFNMEIFDTSYNLFVTFVVLQILLICCFVHFVTHLYRIYIFSIFIFFMYDVHIHTL